MSRMFGHGEIVLLDMDVRNSIRNYDPWKIQIIPADVTRNYDQIALGSGQCVKYLFVTSRLCDVFRDTRYFALHEREPGRTDTAIKVDSKPLSPKIGEQSA